MSETTKRDDGGMTGRYLVVNRATGQVVTDVDDWAEAVEVRDGCEEDSPNHAYLIAEAATPPTPDLDAVRRRLVNVFQRANTSDLVKLAEQLGTTWQDVGTLADALLAAVSRPAEARGEPSEAMVEAFALAWAMQKTLEKHNHERIRASLRAALAAQREQTP